MKKQFRKIAFFLLVMFLSITVLPGINAYANTTISVNQQNLTIKKTDKENIVTQVKDDKIYEFVYSKEKDIVTATIKESNTNKIVNTQVIDIGKIKERAKERETAKYSMKYPQFDRHIEKTV